MDITRRIHNVIGSLKPFLRSNGFFYSILGIFIVQTLFFIVLIDKGVVPDESRHFGNIQFYAQRGIFDGPIVDSVSGKELVLGEVQRFPSYLYYYVMSFPAKVMYHFGATDAYVYLMLRILTMLSGLAGLIVLRKLLLESNAGKAISNLTILALSMTGMYVWMSAGVNYDIPALLLFFLVILFSIRFYKKGKATDLLLLLASFFTVSITKYTYIPFAAAVILAAVVATIRKKSSIKEQVKSLRKSFALSKKRQPIALAIISLVLAGSFILFAERIGGNLLMYRSFNPTCSKIHTVQECLNFAVFERNYERSQEYKNQLADGSVQPYTYKIFEHSGLWVESYFTSAYTYKGHVKEMRDSVSSSMYILAIAMIVLFTYMLLTRRTHIFTDTTQKFLVLLGAGYLLAMYVFNVLLTIRYGGETYAYQGRYILLSLAMFYLLFLLTARSRLRSDSSGYLTLAVLVVSLLCVYTFSPFTSFFVHMGSGDWFSESAKRILEMLNLS